LTERALPLFFDVLRLLLTGEVTVVAEAAFQDHVWRPRLEELTTLAELRVIQCHVEPAIAHARRRVEPGAHARLADSLDDWERAYASFDRVSIAAPSIEVETANGYTPSLDEIIEFVNGEHRDRCTRSRCTTGRPSNRRSNGLRGPADV
jgi:hypothetical protein